MQPLLLVACLAAYAVATTPADQQEAIKKVFRTWRHGKAVEVLEHPEKSRRDWITADNLSERDHHRSKRSALLGPNGAAASQQLSASRSCNTPGYTGEFCEFPICYETNPKLPYIPDDETVAIDAATLANCTENYVVFVDETMFDITIDLEMDTPLNPIFTLQGEDGQNHSPDTILTQTRDQYQAFFFFLPPGRYLLTPSADLKTTSCIMSVRARTAITINSGFVIGEGPNTERSDFPQDYTFYREPASVIVHGNFLRYPAMLKSINFIGEGNTMYRPRLLSTRFNCSYEYIFETFYCKKTGSYVYQVEGVSFQGYSFRRLFPFNCLVNPATPSPSPSTPSPAPLVRCKNNGVFIKNLDGSSYCYCTGLFSGPDCGTRLCANGGSLDTANNKCLCPDGFVGDFCENVFCNDNTGLTFDAEHPTLTLVIRTRTQLADVITQVSNAVSALVNDLSFDPDYLRRFVLVTFNNNRMSTNTYTDSEKLLIALNAAAKTTDSNGTCVDIDFIALSAALSQYLTYKSPVYVITDALPSDGTEVDNVYHLVNDWRSPVYFLYVEPLPESGCTTSIEDPAYRLMDTVAQRSAGQTFYFTSHATIGTFLTTHMLNTLYRTQMLLSNDLPVCSNQLVYKSVSVDSSIQMLVIVATGRNISLVLTNPDGDWAITTEQYTDGVNNIWLYNGPQVGNWLFSFRSSAATQSCSYKIYQAMYHTPGRDTQMDLFWSTSINIDSDMGLPQPLFGLQHAIVMHLTNYPVGVPPERVQASLTINANRNGKPTQVYASNGIWRDVCNYNFYFPPFMCRRPNELLHFNFFAQDLLGFAVQRAGVMYCAEIAPPPTSLSGCQNGGVMNPTNTSCICPPGFSGNLCEQVQCYNGGKYIGNQCSCPIGWTGSFCELPKCINKGLSPEFILNQVDMVFMVELTAQAHAQVVSLNMQFAEIIRDVQAQSRTWINRFYLVGFNSTWADVMAVSSSRDPHQVIDTLNRLAGVIPTDTGCRVQLWQGFERLLRWDIPAGSYVEIFQTSPEENGNLDFVGQLYDRLRSLFFKMNGFLSFTPTFKPDGFACNATQDDYATLFMMVGGSAGTVYPVQPATTADIVRVIPLQYQSAIVYGQYSYKCKTPMKIYFPVDAYAQTIQIDAFGYQKTVHIYDGNGLEVEGFSLVHDTYAGWDIVEIRQDCDEGWEKIGQYCALFVVQSKNFTDAQNHCHSAGGSLVDDLTDGKHQYLASVAHGFNFWIGLYNNGSTYLWDRPNGVAPLPLTQDQQYWKGGGSAPPYDQNASCVFWNDAVTDGNTWTLGSCTARLPFLCQKHQYDENHLPNAIGDDDLPAGKWSMSISVDPAAGQPEICSVNVQMQSSLQMVVGFTTDVASDYPYLDPIADSQTNRIISYVHSADNEHRTPVLTHALLLDAYNETFYNAATYEMRAGCSFPWVTQTFNCPNAQNKANEFLIAHIGEDEFGNMFQRMTLAHCNKADLSCGNGGVRYNGSCICTEYWTGRFCTVPICVNGGTRSSSENQCMCPKGYTGPNCQFEDCTKRSPITFSTDAKTFVLVAEATQQSLAAINGLVAQLTAIVTNATANHPKWFANYVLVTFDSTGASTSASFSSIQALVFSLNSAAGRATDSGKCNLPVYQALQNALKKSVAYPNSEVFVITTAAPSDDTNRQGAVELISDSQAHVNYIYVSTDACVTQNSTLSTAAATAYGSGGSVAITDTSNLNNYLAAFLPTLYGTSMLTDPTYHTQFTCTGNTDWYVQIDKNTTSIFVAATSQYGSLGVINPLNMDMAPNVLFNVGGTKLYEIDTDGLPGIYTLALTSPGACYVHVYSYGGAKVYTEFSITTTSDPRGSHIDGQQPHPAVGAENIATFHLDGPPGQRGYLQYVEVISPDTQTLVLRSDLYRRGMCTFEYYSDPFYCQTESLALFIYGVDEYNQQFRRMEQFFCVDHSHTVTTVVPTTVVPPVTVTVPSVPTPQPVATTTIPSPVATTTNPPLPTSPGSNPSTVQPAVHRFDILFLIDVSEEAKGRLSDMNSFVASVMSAYDVSQQNARVAIIAVGSVAMGAIPVANFDTIDSNQNLLYYINLVSTYTDFNDAGQAIAQALNIAVNNDFMHSGYRTDLKNHVIVYVTATTKFDDQPQGIADKIRKAGSYGIIVVGYGPLATDQNALQSISGGIACTFTANSSDALLTQVAAVKQLIDNADTNGGKYCGN
uniref:EGF-like domain-containing protein n=2 Tax=Haemonchus contortus TaxID=6289 RepID=A0A7I4YI23_HAECO